MTARVALAATAAIVVVLAATELAARLGGIRWRFAGGPRRVTSLGPRWFFGAAGIIATLWLPTAASLLLPAPPAPDPLRYRYVTLDSGEARLFVARRIPAAWQPEIARNAFIVPNGPFLFLRKLLPPPPEEIPTSPDILQEPALAASQRAATWIAITWRELESALSADEGWNALASYWHSQFEYMTFWRHADADDWEAFRHEDPDWIEFDMKLGEWLPPPGFAFIHTSMNECEGIPLLVLVPRTVRLRLLVIENASGLPVPIGAISYRANDRSAFRSASEEERLTGGARLESRQLLPAGKLLPGERLIIPLRIVFRFDENAWFFHGGPPMSDGEAPHDYRARVSAAPDEWFDISWGGSVAWLPGSTLARILERDDPVPDLEDELVFGPSVEVESIVAAGATRKIRPFRPEAVVIRGPSGEGSCPFVFTRASSNDRWHNEGVILKANKGAANAGSDSRKLTRFDGKVVLQELEPEVTILERAFVRAILPDGSTRTLLPRHAALREVDGAVVTVTPRHPLAIEFEPAPSVPGAQYELVVHGYFTPLPPARIRPATR